MMYKDSLILQHSELKNEPKQATISLAPEREGNSNMGKKQTNQTPKKLVHKQIGGAGEKKEKEKAATRTQAAGAQGLGRTLSPQ